MSSHELSRETQRSRPVHGGKKTCSRCDKPRRPGSAYCTEHKNAYQREWAARRTAEFRAHLALIAKNLANAVIVDQLVGITDLMRGAPAPEAAEFTQPLRQKASA